MSWTMDMLQNWYLWTKRVLERRVRLRNRCAERLLTRRPAQSLFCSGFWSRASNRYKLRLNWDLCSVIRCGLSTILFNYLKSVQNGFSWRLYLLTVCELTSCLSTSSFTKCIHLFITLLHFLRPSIFTLFTTLPSSFRITCPYSNKRLSFYFSEGDELLLLL